MMNDVVPILVLVTWQDRENQGFSLYSCLIECGVQLEDVSRGAACAFKQLLLSNGCEMKRTFPSPICHGASRVKTHSPVTFGGVLVSAY